MLYNIRRKLKGESKMRNGVNVPVFYFNKFKLKDYCHSVYFFILEISQNICFCKLADNPLKKGLDSFSFIHFLLNASSVFTTKYFNFIRE